MEGTNETGQLNATWDSCSSVLLARVFCSLDSTREGHVVSASSVWPDVTNYNAVWVRPRWHQR